MYNERTTETDTRQTGRTITPVSARSGSYQGAYRGASATSGTYSRASSSSAASGRNSYYQRRTEAYNSTRIAVQGTSARVLEPDVQEKERVKPQVEKKRRPGAEWHGLFDYFRKTHAITKLAVIAFVFTAVAAIAVTLVGALGVARAQSELKDINEQIESINESISIASQDYFSSVSSTEASSAANEKGMTRSAQSTPIHP